MNVGDYVRTEYGIAKIVLIDEKVNACQIDNQLNGFSFVLNENIIKSSPNIIDLIEVGDYVNGVRVEEVSKKEDLCFIYLENGFDDVDNDYVLEYGIVTKEQFSSMEYKI